MDVNGAKFYLLLGQRDWQRCTIEGAPEPIRLLSVAERQTENNDRVTGPPAVSIPVAYDAHHEALILHPKLFQFRASKNDTPPKLPDRRGAARDRFGNWYWISTDRREILVNSVGSGHTTHFWAACDGLRCDHPERFGQFQQLLPDALPEQCELSGLTVTTDHYLVVGTLRPGGLLIFDLHATAAPRHLRWPADIEFTPWDFSARPQGGLWILERDLNDARKPVRCWALDRYFNVEREQQADRPQAPPVNPFLTLCDDGSTQMPERTIIGFPTGIALEAASPLAALDAIAIETLPDDSVLLLDRNAGQSFSRVWRYRFAQQLGAPVDLKDLQTVVEMEGNAAFHLVAHDFAFVPAENDRAQPAQLVLADHLGNQSFAFHLTYSDHELKLTLQPVYLPMRLFGGKGLVTAGQQAYYDFADRWIPLICQARPRYEESATLLTTIMDSRLPDCVWHRLLLDGSLPPETNVEIWSRAANEKQTLASARWQKEPALHRRREGTELPFFRNPLLPQGERAGSGTWELGLQRAHGQYLQLKIRLQGDGRTTPRLHALRAYYPRFSYLENYLPAVYREDEGSASFLDRFLANLEGIYTTIEERIAAAQILFDVQSAPAETLEWLASWFGLALDPSWEEARRRLLLRHVMELFQYRGTIPGLQMALRLALDECLEDTIFTEPFGPEPAHGIRIIERYRTRRTPGLVLGDTTTETGFTTVAPNARWRPENSVGDLHRRYREFLAQQYRVPEPLPSTVVFPFNSPMEQQAPLQQTESQAEFVRRKQPEDEMLWRDFLRRRYTDINALNAAHAATFGSFDAVPLPDTLPLNSVLLTDWNDFIAEKASLWQQFAQATLSFVPATPTGSSTTIRAKRWQEFLQRRHRTIAVLNGAYAASYANFQSVPLPQEIPVLPAPLRDWFQFEAVVQPMHAAAHRFTVLLPLPGNREHDRAEQKRRLAIAARVLEWEKPAHTTFEVKFYYALFRVGAVRLGRDTVLGAGSRTPQLLSPFVLDDSYISESFLAPGHPQDVRDRVIVGRDRLRAGQRLSEEVI